MIRFLIASHGQLADGFKSAIAVIMGQEIADRIATINAFVEDGAEDVKGIIENFVRDISSTDKLIVFSDIMHGSVNQFLMPLIDDEKVFVITGVNFPLICELVARYSFSEELDVTLEELLATLEKAKDEMILVNHYVKPFVFKDNDDDFFE